MAERMDVDAATPPTWRLVKGEGRVEIARPPPHGAPLLERGALTEELESDVSEDEEEPGNKQPARRRKGQFRGRRLRQRRRWRLDAPDAEPGAPAAFVGSREGGVSSTYVLLREAAAGAVEAVAVGDWFAFRPPVNYAVPTSKDVEGAMGRDQVRFDVQAAARLQPWRRDAATGAAPTTVPLAKQGGALGRLAQRFEDPDKPKRGRKPKALGGGGATAAAALFKAEGDAREDFGLNAGGQADDEDEVVEGRGEDGLDVDDAMSDDEADEEKHDNTGLFFRDDAISSDDEAAGDGDGDDEPAKDPSKADAQAKRDKAAAAALKDREGKRAWREADHVEQQQAKKRKKVVDSGTEAWDTSDAVELAKARAAAAAAAPAAKRAKPAPKPLEAAEVRAVLEAAGGRMKTKDLLVQFKKRLKEHPENKDRIRAILKQIADVVEEAGGARVLVLKR